MSSSKQMNREVVCGHTGRIGDKCACCIPPYLLFILVRVLTFILSTLPTLPTLPALLALLALSTLATCFSGLYLVIYRVLVCRQ